MFDLSTIRTVEVDGKSASTADRNAFTDRSSGYVVKFCISGVELTSSRNVEKLGDEIPLWCYCASFTWWDVQWYKLDKVLMTCNERALGNDWSFPPLPPIKFLALGYLGGASCLLLCCGC